MQHGLYPKFQNATRQANAQFVPVPISEILPQSFQQFDCGRGIERFINPMCSQYVIVALVRAGMAFTYFENQVIPVRLHDLSKSFQTKFKIKIKNLFKI